MELKSNLSSHGRVETLGFSKYRTKTFDTVFQAVREDVKIVDVSSGVASVLPQLIVYLSLDVYKRIENLMTAILKVSSPRCNTIAESLLLWVESPLVEGHG